MLSILIPTYNYDTLQLVLELKNQADALGIEYEILVQDDCSSLFVEENSRINELKNCFFNVNENNIGRTSNRNILATNSKYDLLLFLDADIFPSTDSFISTYLNQSLLDYKAVFGGYEYSKKELDNSKILRYKYGKLREEKEASIRNIKPYSSVFSGNMLIEKKTFFECNFKSEENLYGMDIYFGYQLFLKKIPINHINNTIIHEGLETNTIFFGKTLKSIESRKKHMVDKEGIEKINSLLKYYIIIRKLKLTKIIAILFTVFQKRLKNKILNTNPNLFYLDIYRLGYICYIK